MAEQFANGNHSKKCPYCGGFVADSMHSICKSCGKPVLKWDV